MTKTFLRGVTADPTALSLEGAAALLAAAGTHVLRMALPVTLAVSMIAFAAAILQGGLAVRFELLTPELSRLSPLEGVRKLFNLRSSARGLFAVAKIALVGWLLLSALISLGSSELLAAVGTFERGSVAVLTACWKELTRFGVLLGLGLLFLALLDYGFQRWIHERGLRMTPAEIREELNRLEGNAALKHRRRRVWSTIPGNNAS